MTFFVYIYVPAYYFKNNVLQNTRPRTCNITTQSLNIKFASVSVHKRIMSHG